MFLKDYISENPISPVTITSEGTYLNKDITEIKSKVNSDETISYQSLQLFVDQDLGSVETVQSNFDLIWDVYSNTNYDGNILTDSLDTFKEYWHSINLKNFEVFLAEHPMLHTDGFYYGVEEVDRNEMMQQFQSYLMKENAGLNPTSIQWHNKKAACKDFTLEEFLGLSLAIEQYTLPYYNEMQKRKENIFNAETKSDVIKVSVKYE